MADIRNIDFTDSIMDAMNGDAEAFAFIYRQTYAHFRSIVVKQFGNSIDTDDIMQEVYTTIYTELSSLQNYQAFLTWGAQICRHTAINAYKRRNALKNSQIDYYSPIKDSEDELSMDDFEASVYDRNINPEADIDASETTRLVNEILDTLPENQRICIVLWSENRTYQEIADDIGMPLGTVKSNIRYAKKKVKAKVEALAAQGTRLYGMAPIPFFLWLLKEYDLVGFNAKAFKPDEKILKMLMDKLYREHLTGIKAKNVTEEETKTDDTGSEVNNENEVGGDNTGGGNDQTNTDSSDPNENGSGEDADAGNTETETGTSDNVKKESSDAAGNAIQNMPDGGMGKAVISGIAVKSIMIAVICVVAVIFVVVLMKSGFSSDETVDTDIVDEADSAVSAEIETEPDEKTQTRDDIISTVSISELPERSPELAEMLNLKYVGNEVYYGKNSLTAPLGCIGAYVYDLDQDGQSEIVTIENEDASFEFSPMIRVYEYEGGWYLEAEMQLSSDALESSEYTLYTSWNCIYFLYESYVLVYMGDYNIKSYHYNGGALTEETNEIIDSMSFWSDVYAAGAEEIAKVTGLYADSNNLTWYEYTWSGVQVTGYGIALTDFTEMSYYEGDGYRIYYPNWQDSCLNWIATEEEVDIVYSASDVKDCESYSWNGEYVELYSIYERSYEECAELIEDVSGYVDGFPIYGDGRATILWHNGEKAICFMDGSFGEVSYISTAVNDQNMEVYIIGAIINIDSSAHNALNMVYQFESLIGGTTFPQY